MSEAAQREWRFYLGIHNDTLWSIIRDDVPALLRQLKILREQYA